MREAILILIMLVFNGCWLMPYKENFSCNSDIEAGRCAMVRDNFENNQIKIEVEK